MRHIYLLLAFLPFAAWAQVQPQVATDRQQLTTDLNVLEELGPKVPAEQLTAATFSAATLDSASGGVKLNNAHSSWVRVPAEVPVGGDYVLMVAGSDHADFRAYVADSTGQLRFLARDKHLPFYTEASSRPVILAAGKHVFYVHARATELRFYLQPMEGYYRDHQREEAPNQAFMLLFFGMCIIMLLYNAALYFTLHDRQYLVYLAYLVLLTCFFVVGSNLYLNWMAEQVPFYLSNLANLFIAGAFVAILTFMRAYVRTPQDHPRVDALMRVGYLLNALTFTMNLAAMFGFVLPRTLYVIIQQGTSLYVLVVGVSAILVSLFGGYKPARMLLMAFIPVVLGGFIYVLKNLGVLPETPFTSNVVYFGSALEAALLSIALGDRINLIKAERAKAIEENQRIVAEQNKMLELKVAERTREIQEQNHALEAMNEEILQQRDEIQAINDNLMEANTTIKEKNQEITDSIRYAQRIQQALLPRPQQLQEVLGDVCLFFRPKDILSGDFYWTAQVGSKTVVAAVDCTGHGVPGAFVSLTGYHLLNQIVREYGESEPDQILRELDLAVRRTLDQDNGTSGTAAQDGMDISLVVIDRDRRTLRIASANRPALLYRGGERVDITGDKLPVGGRAAEAKQYTVQEFQYQPGDRLFLFSDGFTDQFDAENRRKFTLNRFRDLLNAHVQLPMPALAHQLGQEHDTWRGPTDQTDDILVLGLTLN